MDAIGRLLGGLGERIAAVVLALSAAQFPVYYTAYSNTLAGARVEAEARYLELQREAAALDLSVQAFIEHHEQSPDGVFQASGRMHRTTLEHFLRYTSMEQALRDANAWERPLALAKNFDRALAEATHFEPGLPLSAEGAAYAFAGLLLAWVLTALVGAVLGPRRPRPALR
ncbi:MAG TPA: DUF2937 family protein [Solimonas sp.]|nr:DUF2937 family protein [Solimonas sp.]